MYQDIAELPMYKFMSCLSEKSLEGLIVSGKPTKQELRERWQKLYDEYFEHKEDLEDLFISAFIKRISAVLPLIPGARIVLTSMVNAPADDKRRAINSLLGTSFTFEGGNLMPEIHTCFDALDNLEKLVYEQREYIKTIAAGTQANNFTPEYYKAFIELLKPIYQSKKVVSESITVYEFLDLLRYLRDTNYYSRLNSFSHSK